MTKVAISNQDDVIDSRDVIARIEELESMLPESAGDVMPGTSAEIAEVKDELARLLALRDEADCAEDWAYGATLIRYSYFKDYAQELAEDCCPVQRNSDAAKILESWPYRCIDWDQAARELRQDYFAVDFDGVEYLVR